MSRKGLPSDRRSTHNSDDKKCLCGKCTSFNRIIFDGNKMLKNYVFTDTDGKKVYSQVDPTTSDCKFVNALDNTPEYVRDDNFGHVCSDLLTAAKIPLNDDFVVITKNTLRYYIYGGFVIKESSGFKLIYVPNEEVQYYDQSIFLRDGPDDYVENLLSEKFSNGLKFAKVESNENKKEGVEINEKDLENKKKYKITIFADAMKKLILEFYSNNENKKITSIKKFAGKITKFAKQNGMTTVTNMQSTTGHDVYRIVYLLVKVNITNIEIQISDNIQSHLGAVQFLSNKLHSVFAIILKNFESSSNDENTKRYLLNAYKNIRILPIEAITCDDVNKFNLLANPDEFMNELKLHKNWNKIEKSIKLRKNDPKNNFDESKITVEYLLNRYPYLKKFFENKPTGKNSKDDSSESETESDEDSDSDANDEKKVYTDEELKQLLGNKIGNLKNAKDKFLEKNNEINQSDKIFAKIKEFENEINSEIKNFKVNSLNLDKKNLEIFGNYLYEIKGKKLFLYEATLLGSSFKPINGVSVWIWNKDLLKPNQFDKKMDLYDTIDKKLLDIRAKFEENTIKPPKNSEIMKIIYSMCKKIETNQFPEAIKGEIMDDFIKYLIKKGNFCDSYNINTKKIQVHFGVKPLIKISNQVFIKELSNFKKLQFCGNINDPLFFLLNIILPIQHVCVTSFHKKIKISDIIDEVIRHISRNRHSINDLKLFEDLDKQLISQNKLIEKILKDQEEEDKKIEQAKKSVIPLFDENSKNNDNSKTSNENNKNDTIVNDYNKKEEPKKVVIGNCSVESCPKKEINEGELYVELECHNDCKLLYHYACWRPVSKNINGICPGKDCGSGISRLVSIENDIEHDLNKGMQKKLKESSSEIKPVNTANEHFNIPVKPVTQAKSFSKKEFFRAKKNENNKTPEKNKPVQKPKYVPESTPKNVIKPQPPTNTKDLSVMNSTNLKPLEKKSSLVVISNKPKEDPKKDSSQDKKNLSTTQLQQPLKVGLEQFNHMTEGKPVPVRSIWLENRKRENYREYQNYIHGVPNGNSKKPQDNNSINNQLINNKEDEFPELISSQKKPTQSTKNFAAVVRASDKQKPPVAAPVESGNHSTKNTTKPTINQPQIPSNLDIADSILKSLNYSVTPAVNTNPTSTMPKDEKHLKPKNETGQLGANIKSSANPGENTTNNNLTSVTGEPHKSINSDNPIIIVVHPNKNTDTATSIVENVNSNSVVVEHLNKNTTSNTVENTSNNSNIVSAHSNKNISSASSMQQKKLNKNAQSFDFKSRIVGKIEAPATVIVPPIRYASILEQNNDQNPSDQIEGYPSHTHQNFNNLEGHVNQQPAPTFSPNGVVLNTEPVWQNRYISQQQSTATFPPNGVVVYTQPVWQNQHHFNPHVHSQIQPNQQPIIHNSYTYSQANYQSFTNNSNVHQHNQAIQRQNPPINRSVAQGFYHIDSEGNLTRYG